MESETFRVRVWRPLRVTRTQSTTVWRRKGSFFIGIGIAEQLKEFPASVSMMNAFEKIARRGIDLPTKDWAQHNKKDGSPHSIVRYR